MKEYVEMMIKKYGDEIPEPDDFKLNLV